MNLDQLVTEIHRLIRLLEAKKINQMSGDDLSVMAPKLASYNTTLGEHVGAAEYAADMAKAHYELVRAQSYNKARKRDLGVGDAENTRELESQDQKAAYLEAKHQHKVLSILHGDVREVIKTIVSRKSYLQSEKEIPNV